MPNLTTAPGSPGLRPTWTSSAKDVVTTALGTSRVWVTLGYGIINEVYWPATGTPQIRDLGFIIAGPAGWFEVKRVNRYRISVPKPYVPLPQILHEGEGYQLALEVTPDPARDVVLIQFRLTGDNMRLYALLAPHLGNGGEHNNARAGNVLTAWKETNALCLVSDCGFSRTSAGYVGSSDGWQDFSQNGRMTWTHQEALDGNGALLGELQENQGTLALGFAESVEGATTLACSSLSVGYPSVRRDFVAGWEAWGKTLRIPDAPAAVKREAYLSAVVLKVHQDRTYPGAVVASLSVPWGNSSDSSGGYHLVWTRDCVEAGLALLAVGQVEDARCMLSYLVAIQKPDGHWSQNGFPDGRPFWTGIQLDQVGFPVILAAKLAEQNALAGLGGVETMVQLAARYLVHNGPISPQDRWEENAGLSPFTLAIEIVALVAAAEFMDGEERDYLLSLADYWNERVEDWTFVTHGPLARQCESGGYYVRIGPAAAQCGLRGHLDLRNRPDGRLPAAEIIGMEYLYLVRLGLRKADDPRILGTFEIADRLLKVETPLGIAYHRYNGDGYGEQADGSPFDGNGVGRAWPLLTGERGHFELQRGHDPLPYLEMMTRMTGPSGLIPEQVWDGPAQPSRGLEPGKPTGSAMPLVWAHAEFLKLLCGRDQERPIDLLGCVEEHYRGRPIACEAWHWRLDTPFRSLPADRDLLIEMPAPFALHLGFDGWQAIEDRPSAPIAFGMHAVRLLKSELHGRQSLDFTCYFTTEARWEGRNHRIRLTPGERNEPLKELRAMAVAGGR